MKTSAEWFARLCAPYAAVDVEVAERTVAYYRGSKSARESLRGLQQLETDWYESVARGEPDYGVYARPEMLVEVWACYVVYSHEYIRRLSRLALSVDSVVDVGCGCGFSTALLKSTYQTARVFGTNVPGPQHEVAKAVGVDHGFTVASDFGEVGEVDMLFASEYFEHFEKPIQHLDRIRLPSCSLRPDGRR